MSNENKRLREALETMYWSGWSDCNALGYENCNGETMLQSKMDALKDIATVEDVAPKTKTSRFGSARRPDGRRPVYFFIDNEWVHKGWLLPQVGNDV